MLALGAQLIRRRRAYVVGDTVAMWIARVAMPRSALTVVASIGSSVGYYLPAYFNAVRWSLREQNGGWWSRAAKRIYLRCGVLRSSSGSLRSSTAPSRDRRSTI